MHFDGKRLQQWVFLGVLFVAAGAEVAGNIMAHARRLQEVIPTTQAMGESVSAHFGWCRK